MGIYLMFVFTMLFVAMMMMIVREIIAWVRCRDYEDVLLLLFMWFVAVLYYLAMCTILLKLI